MKIITKALVLCILLICQLGNSLARAEDVNALLTKVKDLVEQKNYSKALNELNWVEKEIQTMNMKRMEDFFPNTISGFTGGQFNPSAALGFTNLEREYSNGENKIKISLVGTGGGAGDAMAGLGGLAGLGKMAAMFGGQTPGQETTRINGRTTQLTETNTDYPKATVFMDGGSMINIETLNGKVTVADLKKVAETLDLNALDAYIRG